MKRISIPIIKPIGLVLLILTCTLPKNVSAQTSDLKPIWLGENNAQGISETKLVDLDNDGDKDLIFSTRNSIKWMDNVGGGSFNSPIDLFSSKENLVTFTTGDIDNDGDQDLVLGILTQRRENEVWLLSNEGNGQFAEAELLLGENDIQAIEDLEIIKYAESNKYLLYVSNVIPSPVVQAFSLENEVMVADTLYENDEYTSWVGALVESDLNADGYPDFVIYNYRSIPQIGVLLSRENSEYEYMSLDNTEGGTFKHVILTDVDNDQDMDIIASFATIFTQEGNPPDRLYMFENQGSGIFSEGIQITAIPELISTRDPYQVTNLAALDVNSDGLEEIIVARETSDWEPGKLLWLENQGDLTFSEPTALPSSMSDFDNLLSEDIDGDGVKDLLASSSVSSKVDWFKKENQTGGFSEQRNIIEPSITSPLDITAFEVLGSLKGIFVASKSSEKAITYFKNNGNLSFDQPVVLDTSFSYATQLEHSDVNRDGYEDLVALTRKKRRISGTTQEFQYHLKWFENKKNSTFSGPVTIRQAFTEQQQIHFAIGDKDGDGDDDIALLLFPENIDQPYLHVLENGGRGEFSKHEYIFLPAFSPLKFVDNHSSLGEELVLNAIENVVEGRNFKNITTLYSFNLDSVRNSELIEEEDALATINITKGEVYVDKLNVEAGDINGDQVYDYIAGTELIPNNTINNTSRKMVTVIRNENTTQYEVITIDSTDLDFRHIALTDVDQDTDLDIIVEMGEFTTNNSIDRWYKSHLTWYKNDGTGQFTRQDTIDSGIIDSGSFLNVDLNNDGNSEIISVRNAAGNVAVYEGSEIGTITSTSDEYEMPDMPTQISLSQNYPNPFNPSTTISYSIPQNAVVQLKVFNMLGQEVQVLVNEQKTAGRHQVQFDASSLASGVYIYQLKAAETFVTRKMILLK